MKRNRLIALLVVVVVVCFGVAVSYPIKYWMEDKRTEESMDRLLAMRSAGLARGASEDRGAEESGGALDADFGEGEVETLEEEPWTPGEDEGGAESESLPEDASEPSGTSEPSELSEPDSSDDANAQAGGSTFDGEAPQPGPSKAPGGDAALDDGEASSGNAEGYSSDDAVSMETVSPISPSGTATPGQSAGARDADEDDSSGDSDVGFGAIVGGAWPIIDYSALTEDSGEASSEPELPTFTPVPTPSPTPGPTVNRFERDEAVPYEWKEKVTLDESAILPQYREIYEENHDFVGWITIPGTNIDYPVVQCEDSDYYLKHDFFGNRNANGQIILDTKCDPYTPSYNLVISGHSMKSGKMFGWLVNYMYESYWKKRKIVYFDTLMEQKTYVIFAAFFSANYDEDEEGFRYNADIEYNLDAKQWLREIEENQLYDTGIDAEFGDEFLTLTTCNKVHHKDGRFVVVCRRLREGEEIE